MIKLLKRVLGGDGFAKPFAKRTTNWLKKGQSNLQKRVQDYQEDYQNERAGPKEGHRKRWFEWWW